ncbi:peptidylprolyl isomerase [Halobacteriovorax sp. HLS]|uniref:peptidylprolyl isomerase n=1 Tax=Halobacteriovorax sp. HLS TaxID=2234000 RepID=UPI0019D47CBC|nr:peptidylprolyl isomerase [Halobacteriovorax sp. HLS]
MKVLIALILAMTTLTTFAAKKRTTVVMETTKGNIEIELFEDSAPISSKNFLSYVDSKFYEGTIFHRVIDNFMIQGGGYDSKLVEKKTMPAIKNEATNRISNSTGTIAMARTSSVNSATSQFFINVNNNTFLDHRSSDPREFGYAVFGKVTKGMSVVNVIKKAAKSPKGAHTDLPAETIMIKKVYVKK